MAPIPKKSTVCVTGAGGYVGGWVVKTLLDKGYSVRACVRDAGSERSAFLRQMAGFSTGDLTLSVCDVTKPGSLDEVLSGCHGLVHAAADADTPLEKRPEEYGTTARHVINSVNNARSIVRVIYTSSVASIMGYTDPRELRLRPTIDEMRYPDMSCERRVNGYVEGKLQCESLFLEAAKASGGRWDAFVTNPTDNIGPVLSRTHVAVRKAYTPWHCIIAQIIESGKVQQSYGYRPWWIVDVRDTAEVHVGLLGADIAAGVQDGEHASRYLVCSTETINVEDIGSRIADLLPEAGFDTGNLAVSGNDTEAVQLTKLDLTELEMRAIWAGCKLCNTKVRAVLGINFRPLDTSLRDCVESLISVAGVRPSWAKGTKRIAEDMCHTLEGLARPKLDSTVVRAATAEEIPVIDVGDLLSGRPGSAPALAAQIKQACIGTGFFYVSSHGLEQHLKLLLESMKEYFDTPETDKAAASIDQYQRGFRGQGFDQEPGCLPDCKESFDVGVDLPLTHAAVAARVPMHGPNQWPSHFPALRAPTKTYFSACEVLGRKLLAAIACSLGEAEEFFEPHCSEAMVQMRMFHYPPPPEDQIGQFGSSPHTDYGMITLLAQDPIGGLEVQTLGGEWVRAPYIEGTLVINLGDMLSLWTNDVYHSTLHRVINRARKDRYSIAMFYHLNADTFVTPLVGCCADNELPKYKPIKYLSHLTSRFEEVLKAKF